MSLAIDVDKVTEVLLADGWHSVWNWSFTLDSYEFLWWPNGRNDPESRMTLHSGGDSGVCAVGFQFAVPGGLTISGPLTAILAVNEDQNKP